MRIFSKAYEVYIPMTFMPSILDYPLMKPEYFSEDWSEGQQCARRSTSHAKLYQYTMFHGARYTWLER